MNLDLDLCLAPDIMPEVDTAVCPHCGSPFSSLDALAQHLNAGGAGCVSTKATKIPTSDEGETNDEGQYHKHSGYTYGQGMTLLDRLKTHGHENRRQHQMYHPFPNKGEWELGRFLVLTLTREGISEFLKLKFVCNLPLLC